jgi:hypothetical protein
LGLVRVANRGIDERPLVRSCFAGGMSAGTSTTPICSRNSRASRARRTSHENDYSDWSVGNGQFAMVLAQQRGSDL